MRSRYHGLFALTLAAASFLQLPAMADRASARLQLAQAGSEFESWSAIKDSTKAEDYRNYLDKYPNGDFADLAKLRMKKYAAAPAPASVPPEAEPANTQQPAPEPAQTHGAAPEAPAPLSSPAQGMTFETKKTTLYARDGGQVRAAPDPKSALVVKLKSGRPVQATGLSTDGRWWRVAITDGQVGYMHHSVVSDRSEAPPLRPIAEPPPTPPPVTLPVLTPPASKQPVTLPATTQPASSGRW